MVKPGQIWENGKTAVKLQKAEEGIMAITYTIKEDKKLQFSHVAIMNKKDMLHYVKEIGCTLTDKVLTLEN
jgi:hypothetical protein